MSPSRGTFWLQNRFSLYRLRPWINLRWGKGACRKWSLPNGKWELILVHIAYGLIRKHQPLSGWFYYPAKVIKKGLQADAHSPWFFLYKYSYSVLRLRSQPTRPMPMLPNKITPGAGIICGAVLTAQVPRRGKRTKSEYPRPPPAKLCSDQDIIIRTDNRF